jgi:lipopolysaccharide transport system ATP-binding protein
MSVPAIRVEALGKEYPIRGAAAQYDTLRDALVRSMRRPFARPRSCDRIWALRDVSFEVEPGEKVGIIGPNGAGKSTLFKVLSRVVSPSAGRAELRGRLGSLLEVGTGFHPELTGRENIFLYGAVLGMSRREILRRMEEIVEFAEVGPFLDTPVKHYSSGMTLRLAFAVAAHLDTDVLCLDEVLAVGDAAFQRKCLGHLSRTITGGRTVLLVSHNMALVRAFCRRAILLEHGRVSEDGPAEAVVQSYLSRVAGNAGCGEVLLDEWAGERTSPGTARITAVRSRDAHGHPATVFQALTPLVLEADLQGAPPGFTVAFTLEDALGVRVYHLRSDNSALSTESTSGHLTIRAAIPQLRLREGCYYLNVWLGNRYETKEDRVGRVLQVTVVSDGSLRKPFDAVIYEPGEWELHAHQCGGEDEVISTVAR